MCCLELNTLPFSVKGYIKYKCNRMGIDLCLVRRVGSRLPFSAAGCVDGYGYRYIDLV